MYVCMYVPNSGHFHFPTITRCAEQVTLQIQLLDAAKEGRTDELAQLLEQRDVDIDFKDWVSSPPSPLVCTYVCTEEYMIDGGVFLS